MLTECHLSFSQRHILMVVALYQEESSVLEDVTHLTARILTCDKFP